MGSVWLADHIGLDTLCAVKFIHADLAGHPEVRARFEREARAAALIKSPHVVQVIDYGESDGVPYFAMEYLEGEDLARRLDRGGRLSPSETVSVVAQIARALTKAHAAGLVHRDLKPENVFLTGDADQPLVKVLDFGIAKGGPVVTSATRTGALLGTPQYMSPEQAQGARSLDHRSDLWSLGVLAFVCLTAKSPFSGEGYADVLMAICVMAPPVPSRCFPDLPTAFDAWFARACARAPADRFSTAREQADALACALAQAAAPVTPTVASSPAPAVLPPSQPTVMTVAHTLGPPRRGRTVVTATVLAGACTMAGAALVLAWSVGGASREVAVSSLDAAAPKRLAQAAAAIAAAAPATAGTGAPMVAPEIPSVAPRAAPPARRPVLPPRPKKKGTYDPGLL
jgi:serine/threonine-protein kinase